MGRTIDIIMRKPRILTCSRIYSFLVVYGSVLLSQIKIKLEFARQHSSQRLGSAPVVPLWVRSKVNCICVLASAPITHPPSGRNLPSFPSLFFPRNARSKVSQKATAASYQHMKRHAVAVQYIVLVEMLLGQAVAPAPRDHRVLQEKVAGRPETARGATFREGWVWGGYIPWKQSLVCHQQQHRRGHSVLLAAARSAERRFVGAMLCPCALAAIERWDEGR